MAPANGLQDSQAPGLAADGEAPVGTVFCHQLQSS
jgi:hypothetical protein